MEGSNGRGDREKVTCGPLFYEGMKMFARDEHESHLFAAGFAFGNAEKVYLGACLGAMARPSPDAFHDVHGAIIAAAGIYGLTVRLLATTKGTEIWILDERRGALVTFDVLTREEENSKLWHAVRGRLCGVPQAELDTSFHLRQMDFEDRVR